MILALWDPSILVEMTQNNKVDPGVTPSTAGCLQGDHEQMSLSPASLPAMLISPLNEVLGAKHLAQF